MPYINERDRSKSGLNHEGDLNYRIHELIEIYLNGQEKLGYAQYNTQLLVSLSVLSKSSIVVQ